MRRARLLFLALIALSAVLSLALLASRPAPEDPWCARCDIILISLESVGEREAALGSPDTPMPHLASFAKERAFVFERAYAAAPWSLASHAALLTGEYPWDLGVWDGTDAVPPGTPTLAVALAREGYKTALYADGFVRPEFGFGQGFEESGGALAAPRDYGTRVFDEARKALEIDSDSPRFLFIHPDAVRLPYGAQSASSLAALHEKKGGPTAEDAEALRRAYRAELQALDETLGNFLDGLRERGALDRTIVIITSGNGTRFARPQELGLSQSSLSEEVLRVPLVIAVPGKAPGGINASIETRSVPATVLDLIGTYRSNLPGASLVPFMQGEETESRMVQAATAKTPESALTGLLQTDEALERIASGETRPEARLLPYSDPYARMALRGTWKLVVNRDGSRVIRNVLEDPGETRDYRNALPPPPIGAIDELISALLRQ